MDRFILRKEALFNLKGRDEGWGTGRQPPSLRARGLACALKTAWGAIRSGKCAAHWGEAPGHADKKIPGIRCVLVRKQFIQNYIYGICQAEASDNMHHIRRLVRAWRIVYWAQSMNSACSRAEESRSGDLHGGEVELFIGL